MVVAVHADAVEALEAVRDGRTADEFFRSRTASTGLASARAPEAIRTDQVDFTARLDRGLTRALEEALPEEVRLIEPADRDVAVAGPIPSA